MEKDVKFEIHSAFILFYIFYVYFISFITQYDLYLLNPGEI